MQIFMAAPAIALLVGITAFISIRQPPWLRALLWLALAEWMAAAIAQLVYSRVLVAAGGDMALYTVTAQALVKFLDTDFSWASRELLALLFQQPSTFDTIVFGGGGSNTSSMYAACTFIFFFWGGSDYAASFFVAGLAMFGAFGIFSAFRDAYPEANQKRLFIATVMFPSVAFWTATLHKESFCLMGIGATLVAWRAIHRRRLLTVLVWLPVGITLIMLFRPPVLPPLVLGIAMYVALERLQKARGADVIVTGPFYFALGFIAVALAMLLVSRITPALSLDRISDTLAQRQQEWSTSRADSAIGDEDAPAPKTLAGQVARFPIGLLNALFRPQFFDVHNVASLLGAAEMTAILWLLVRAIRRQGLGGFLRQVQRSPFLMMCTVVTLVGCTFVGVATLNLGSLARYRVPFLPFYGAFILSIGLAAPAGQEEGGKETEPALVAKPKRPRRPIPAREPERVS